MATPPKRWPNNADQARMDCIACARHGRKMLLDELDNETNPTILRQMAKALEDFRKIETSLLSVGPKAEKGEC